MAITTWSRRDLSARPLQKRPILEDDEVHVAISRGEILRRGRSAGVHDRRMWLLDWLRLAPDRVGIEALALELELFLHGPGLLEEIQPLGREFVAIVVRTHLSAEHVELVLEPAAHHVEREPSVGDVVDGRCHLGHHQGMNQWHVTRG